MASITNSQLSKTDQVVAALLHRIRGGGIRPGAKLPSEAALMDQYDVSRVTVRRAIRQLVRQGVLESRSGVGHVVRSHQLALTIGLLVGSAEFTPYQQKALEAFERQIRDSGFRSRFYVMRLAGQHSVKDPRPLLNDLRAGELAGMLTVSWSAHDDEEDVLLKQVMDECEVPCVSLSGRESVAAVSNDMFAFGLDGTRHLLELGCRRIALLGQRKRAWTEVERGWREAHGEAGVAADESLRVVCDGPGEAAGYHGFRRWWEQMPQADAMLVPDDHLAKGVLGAAVAAGVDLHQHLRICSLWIKGSELFMPGPFIRVELDPAEMAEAAMSHLSRMIDGEPAPAATRVVARVVDAAPRETAPV